MHYLYEIGKDQVKALHNSPSLDSLRGLFEARTKKWPYPYMEVEGGGIGTFDDLVDGLETYQAFALITPAVQLALEQTDRRLFETGLFLIVSLARVSETTEIPEYLSQSWEMLAARYRTFASDEGCRWLNELRRWYRMGKFG